MMVDEADIDLVGGNSPHRTGNKRSTGDPLGSPRPPNKRKPGPIPRDVLVRRPSPSPPSPVQTPPPPLSPPPMLSPPPSPAAVINLPLLQPPLTPPPLSPAVNGEIGKFIQFY